MRPAEDIRELINDLSDKTSAEMDERVCGDVISALDETKTTESAANRPTIWRTIMRSPISKLAAAAVIVFTVLIVMSQLGGSTGSVAWGEVVRNIEASRGFIYRMKQVHKKNDAGITEFDTITYGSREHGIRMDGYNDGKVTIQTYASLRDEQIISVMHQSKAYTTTPLSGAELAEMQSFEPKEAIKQFLSAGYTKLGRRIIDGVETEGVRVTDPSIVEANFQVDSYTAELWAAVDTGLPVLLESKTVGKGGDLEIHTVQDDFQWNVDLDAGEFVPRTPQDYTQIERETETDGGTTYKTRITKQERSPLSSEVDAGDFEQDVMLD